MYVTPGQSLTLSEYAEAVVSWNEFQQGVRLGGFHVYRWVGSVSDVDIELWDALLSYILVEGE